MKKSAKKVQQKNKKTKKEYFFSWECIKNNTVNILVIVSAILLFNYFRTPVFKIDTTTKLYFETPFTHIPNFDDDESQISWNWFEVMSADITKIDLSNIGNKINFLSFDTNAMLPSADKLPAGFNPNTALENGKNPGLGVRDLHAKGITGKGITVAIIDNGLNIDHQEYKDNLLHYETIGKTFINYHGPAVTSLVCGKTIGVAPEAKLVYFATGFVPTTENEKFDITNDITALNKILNMNKRLPKDKRISAVSISRGWYPENERGAEFKKIVSDLIESGVLVVTANAWDYYGNIAMFGPANRMGNSNPDDVNSYGTRFDMDFIVPAGGRTTAGPVNPDYYMYWGDGGWSWAVPYIVGTWALAKQVYPDLMPKEFLQIAHETGYRLENQNGGYNIVIQPTKIIEYLQNKK